MATYPVYADDPVPGNLVLGVGKLLKESFQDLITAAGSTQATAFPLTSEMNRITTAAANTGVTLPPSAPGLTVFVVNRGANPLTVYGFGVDTVDGAVATTGVKQMPNSTVLYVCHTAGVWETEGLATGFEPGLGLQTVSNGTIAGNATVTQAAGTPVTTSLTNVTAAAAAAVTLPVSVAGLEITIHNISANNVSVFPNAGGTTTETINALSANAAIVMATNTSTTFTCTVAGQWYTVPRVPS